MAGEDVVGGGAPDSGAGDQDRRPLPGESQLPGLWAIVPAGGAGTRLWPLSRRGAPKFLQDLTGSGRSLLQATADRLAPLVGERIVVVTGVAHADAVRDQLPELPGDQILVEPEPRDSMPAIGWAAAWVARRDPDALVGSFAADHVVADARRFRDGVREAAAVAREGWLVTLGIDPTGPATGFGYIRVGEPLDVPRAPTARRAAAFVEKPDATTAAAYLASREYLWNAGMFVVRAAVLDELVRAGHPQLADGVALAAADPGQLPQVWPGLTRIAIDHAVAEPAAAAGRVAVVPARFGWDDIGDFDSLAQVLGGDGLQILGPADDVLAVSATGLVAARSGRLVALVGVQDLVVVDTPDAVLVVSRDRAQEVKTVVERLQSSARSGLT